MVKMRPRKEGDHATWAGGLGLRGRHRPRYPVGSQGLDVQSYEWKGISGAKSGHSRPFHRSFVFYICTCDFYGNFVLLLALVRTDISANKGIMRCRKQTAKANAWFHEVSQLIRVTLVLNVDFASVVISAVRVRFINLSIMLTGRYVRSR